MTTFAMDNIIYNVWTIINIIIPKFRKNITSIEKKLLKIQFLGLYTEIKPTLNIRKMSKKYKYSIYKYDK